MNTVLLLDRDAKTALLEGLKEGILAILRNKGHRVEVVEVGRNDVTPCLGCLLCLTRHVGICVTRDSVSEIRNGPNRYDMTIFLSPVVFGHFNSTVKCAIDRGCGSNNLQVMVGYGEDIDEEERSTFLDLTRRHRGKMDIVHPGFDKHVDVYITTSPAENEAVFDAFRSYD